MAFEETNVINTATQIATNINSIQQRIVQASELSERDAKEVQLLAVSKTKPIALIKEAYHTGQRHFGENYVQESIEKITQIQQDNEFNEKITWHFIGPLQSNKTALVATHFDWVQSIDRLKIAQRLSTQRPAELPPLNVCIQVNISEESAKSGVTSTQALELAADIKKLPNLTLRGIMAIPEKTDDIQKLEAQFTALFDIYSALQQQHEGIDTLSMGMSGDLTPAIKCGSTMVRIGTYIFGSRA
ncbi:MAG TPA: YggS family pyridoxal phosphate-dependent enzyme [Psychromonas hadalis]|nr:YggS family pyridoxal phosphate-dependent enzyme [Psychromonas hadalis]